MMSVTVCPSHQAGKLGVSGQTSYTIHRTDPHMETPLVLGCREVVGGDPQWSVLRLPRSVAKS
jgi:hypothetical protein